MPLQVERNKKGNTNGGDKIKPIHLLLNEIKWNKNLKMEDYEIGYYDRVKKKIIRIRLTDVKFDRGDHFTFALKSREGKEVRIPYHRIKRVWKNGEIIWERKIETI
ncbi:MAG TPA: DUF504 domain-containing protein [Thermoplasmata archaeon]|nr:DUF504 domain-containing protein [Thermoplasmata archaeon]